MHIPSGQLRELDTKGELAFAGFAWQQPIVDRDTFLDDVLLWGGIACWITFPLFLFVLKTGPYPASISYFVFLLAWPANVGIGIVVGVLQYFGWTTEDMKVVFSRDGTIWIPVGSFLRPHRKRKWRALGIGTSEISSIELAAMRNRAGGHYRHGGEDGFLAFVVLMYFRSGERVRVAECLTEDEAHIVVAQLNLARKALRDASAMAA